MTTYFEVDIKFGKKPDCIKDYALMNNQNEINCRWMAIRNVTTKAKHRREVRVEEIERDQKKEISTIPGNDHMHHSQGRFHMTC